MFFAACFTALVMCCQTDFELLVFVTKQFIFFFCYEFNTLYQSLDSIDANLVVFYHRPLCVCQK